MYYLNDKRHDERASSSTPGTLAGFAGALGIVAALLGCVVLVGGWILDVELLRTAGRSFEAGLARTTAVSFILLGSSVVVMALLPGRVATGFTLFSAGAVAIAATADLLLLAAGQRAGLDGALFPTTPATGNIYMSVATAMDFLVASACLLLLVTRVSWAPRVFSVLATFGLITALVALAGYAYDAAALYEVWLFTAMAVHTASGFAFLFVSILVLEPGWSWMRTVVGPGVGSTATRRLLPAILGGPFLLGWIFLGTIRHDIFAVPFSLSLLAILTMTFLAILVLRNGALQNAADRALREANARLRHAVEHRDVLLNELFHRTKNNLQLVDAMLLIEGEYVDSADTRQALAKMSSRVQALSLVYESLLYRADLSAIETGRFLTELCERIHAAADADSFGIAIDVETDDELIEVDHALPVGLIANELISNSLQHANLEGGGRIAVAFVRGEQFRTLSVSDSGRTPLTEVPDSKQCSGYRIITSLVRQLKGSLELTNRGGTRVEVMFPVRNSKRTMLGSDVDDQSCR